MKWPALLPLLAVCLIGVPLVAQESVVVANESHQVEVLRVAQVDSLHGGMLQPESAADAFLLVSVETEDPCFDPRLNGDCFDSEMNEVEKVAWACGHVLIGDEERPADGGGVLDGELTCSFVVPAGVAELTLVLRHYPEVELRAGD